ncbi:MAG: MFS transporter [Pseudolysinimonas sp.]|uniref:MFS transporter n=1 Tax=Pseudolysinimonas sp. TaxID=2680009 RepID=UPI003267ADAD
MNPRRRLLPSLAALTAATFATYGALLSVLLPAQVARVAPDDKVAALALVTSVSFAVAIAAQPLFGTLSDRTRSRLGRRAPWLLACAAASAAILLALGHADVLAWIVIGWAALQFVLNGVDIASSSYLVDRFPRSRRGRVAAVFAAAALAGGGAGILLSGFGASDPVLAYSVLAAVLVVVVGVFVVLNREDAEAAPVAAPRRRWVLSDLDPRRHPDFSWLIGSRISFTVGYQGVYGYLLYIVSDYIGVADVDAPRIVGMLAVVSVGGTLLAAIAGGWLSDRLGRRKPFVIAACLAVAAALSIPLIAPTVGGMFALAALQGVGFGLYSVGALAWASEVLPGGEADAGRDLGLLNVATNLPQALAPLLAAAVIGAWGYSGLFVVGIAGVLLAAGLVLPAGARPQGER